MMIKIAIIFSCIKLLLMPSYHSTDFEVHRNWLAITHSLPIQEWYINETSEWTLDYPPLFAWFEWILSQIAYYFDKKMLIVSNLDYASTATVFFQRLTVIVSDFILAYSLQQCIHVIKKEVRRDLPNSVFLWLFAITFCNAGLLLVDHIHFQYNGFLLGVFFLAIARILQRRELESAFWMAILVNMKHIFVYVCPAFFVFFLRSYVFLPSSHKTNWMSFLRRFSLRRLLGLAVIGIAVCGVSFGPFVAMGQTSQVFGRLFPFKRRGLSHAYWAPNFWALYNFADKAARFVFIRMGWISADAAEASAGAFTGGLVQEATHSVLPSVTPLATFVLTFLFMMPCLVWLMVRSYDGFALLRATVLCALTSFLLGWHVHEKAILMAVMPLSLLSLLSLKEAKYFLLLSIVANFSLFPLIFTSQETVIKVTATLLHACATCVMVESAWCRRKDLKGPFGLGGWIPLFSFIETAYVVGLTLVFTCLHHSLGLVRSMPFLPLMLVSVYCSVGVVYCWAGLYLAILRGDKSQNSALPVPTAQRAFVRRKDGSFKATSQVKGRKVAQKSVIMLNKI